MAKAGGWGEVHQASREQGAGGGVFLSIGDGETVRLRSLDEEPRSYRIHHVSREVNGENVYVPVPATDAADESYVLEKSRLYPPDKRFALRCLVIDENDEVDGVTVLTGGVQIFKPLSGFAERHKDIRLFDIEVTREGEGLRTKWSVNVSPTSVDLNLQDIEEMAEQMLGPELAWDVLFPPTNYDEQRDILARAGIDISVDPAEELAEDMDLEDARAIKFDFGKYSQGRAKTVGEVENLDPRYIDFVVRECTTQGYEIRAACQVVLDHIRGKQIRSKASTAKSSTAKSRGRRSRPAIEKPAEEPEVEPKASKSDRADLQAKIEAAFEEDIDNFPDPADIVAAIKKHGNGKTKLRELTVKQLESLAAEITDG